MTVLRGPADADHFRIKIGRYGDRFYCDPLPADDIAPATDDHWPSVTTIKKASGSDWSYVAMKRIAHANLQSLPELQPDEVYERLKTINKVGLKRAQKRGEQVHLWLEQALRGEKIDDPGGFEFPGSNYYRSVMNFLDTYQPELVAAEMVCINRELGYGGTADAIVTIDGQAYWVDWKSRGEDSDHGAYPEEAAQLGAYANADYMIAEGVDGPKRMLLPELETGLIVSIKPDGVRIYPIELQCASIHFEAMANWWAARRVERMPIRKPWAPRKISKYAPSASTAAETVADALGGQASEGTDLLDTSAVPSDADTVAEGGSTTATAEPPSATPYIVYDIEPAAPERHQWVRDRIMALDVKGRKHLGKNWPEAVPTFLQSDIHTDDELNRIIAALELAEAESNSSWETPDPTRLKPTSAPPAPVEPKTPTTPDEGPDVTPDDIIRTRNLMLDHEDHLGHWAQQVYDDGGRSLNLRQRPSLWRYTVVTALAHAAAAGVDDTMLSELLYGAVVPYTDNAGWVPGTPLGEMIASLNIEEADRLGRLARALGTSDLTIEWSDEGRPWFSGPAWDNT
jgi:hypothetical protein